MARLLGSHAIQAKLTVGPAHDESEREADRVADEVMRMPEPMAAVSVQRAPPTIQRLCHECEEEKEEELKRSPIASQRMCTECEEEVQRESALVQRKCSECEELHRQHATVRSEAPSADPSAPPIVSAVLRSPGASMDHPIRTFMEDRFGTDFSSVRIHTDATAAESARAVNARAYTVGSNVAFGAGQYAPDSTVGRRLLAHELTHVIQQGSASTARGVLSLQRTATAAEPGETGTDLGPVAAASLGSLLPSLPPPCKPATSLLMAKALHAFVSGSFIPFARGMFGPQTTSLWEEYLDTSLGIPRPARAFAGSGEIVRGFTKHHKSAESEQEIVDASVAALRGPASSLLPRSGTTAVVLVTSLVPSATLLTRINSGTDPMGLDYDSPATTIPGNIAGGIGSGGPPGGPTSKDTRDVTGSMQLTVDSAGTTLTVVPSLTFLVHDTVDFCPGALGGRLAQVETVPMSILEATGARVNGNKVTPDGTGEVRLKLIVSENSAVIRGAATKKGQPFAGAMILLLPESGQAEMARRDQSDSDGTFTLSNIVPGKYRLMALVNGWDLPWADAEQQKALLGKGVAVAIGKDGPPPFKIEVE